MQQARLLRLLQKHKFKINVLKERFFATDKNNGLCKEHLPVRIGLIQIVSFSKGRQCSPWRRPSVVKFLSPFWAFFELWISCRTTFSTVALVERKVSIMILSVRALSISILRKMTLSITTLIKRTLTIIIISIRALTNWYSEQEHSAYDTQCKYTQHMILSVSTLSILYSV